MGRELLGGVRAEWQGESVDIERPPPCVEEASPLVRERLITEINVSWAFIFCIIGGVLLLAALLTGCATSF